MRDPKRNSGMFARGSLAMFFFSKVKSFSEEVDTWTGCFSYKSFFLIVHCILIFLGGGCGGGSHPERELRDLASARSSN